MAICQEVILISVSAPRRNGFMSETWISTVPRLSHFAQVADPTQYVPLPDDWHIGAADVIGSTAAIAAGR